MDREEALAALEGATRESRLIDPETSGVVMISGGADSACAAAGLAAITGPGALTALHVNYGLRDSAARGEECARELCALLRLDLHISRPQLEPGNMQAAARKARYTAAEALRVKFERDWIATGHTRTDVAETVLYRLAVSPGRRAMLGLAARKGNVVRPLLGLERSQTRELAGAGGLPFADDETNLDPSFARNRIRSEAPPVLHGLSEAAERNISETRAELAEEGALLERLAEQAIEAFGAADAPVSAVALAEMDPALRRLVLRRLAERAAGRTVALGRRPAIEIMRLASAPEGGQVELGGGLRAVCEAGHVRFAALSEPQAPPPAGLRVPGSCRFGRWQVRAELRPAPVEPQGPELATLDARALGAQLEVRTWREGDRIRPLGMNGTRPLQDVFTDRGVPRSLRRTLPVITSAGRIAWVAGVAVAEDFKLGPGTESVAVLSASAEPG